MTLSTPVQWSRLDDGSWQGPPTKKNPEGLVPKQFSDELEVKLSEIHEVLAEGHTVMIFFENMAEVNERFQAVLDWLKDRGNRMVHRWANGCKMTDGWVYFCPANTHRNVTRGVTLETDLQPFADELVRQKGLDAKLRVAQSKAQTGGGSHPVCDCASDADCVGGQAGRQCKRTGTVS